MQLAHKRIFYINSRNRKSGSHNDMTYEIELGTISPTHVVVLSANIPKSYYSVQDSANTFILEENKSQATITITPGSYTRQQMATNLKTALDNGSPNGYTYTVSYPASSAGETGKLTFSVSGNGGIQPIFIFTSYLYEQLGFNSDSSNQFSGDSLSSSNVIKLQKEDSIFVHSDMVKSSQDNILQEIYSSDTQDYANIVFYNHEIHGYAKEISFNSGNLFRFWLTNEDGDLIDLNGQNYTLTLLVFSYQDKVYSLMLNVLKEYQKTLTA